MTDAVFIPEFLLRDWLALAALILVGCCVVALCAKILFSRQPLGVKMLVTALLLLTAVPITNIARTRLEALTTLQLHKERVQFLGIIGDAHFDRNFPVTKFLTRDYVVLQDQQESIRLPRNATWKCDGLVVNAEYLANEVCGRMKANSLVGARYPNTSH